MTKKTLQLLASAALVAGLGFTTVTANADATSGTGSVSTTAKVTLDSKGAGDNGDGDGGNVAGSLAITSAPDVSFAGGVLDGTTALNLDGTLTNGSESHDKTANAGAVTVVDPGTASGWTVQVANTKMANVDSTQTGAAAMIQGGKINFSSPALASKDSGTDAGVTLQGNADANALSLDTEGTENVPVYNAAKGSGVGTWTDTFSKSNLSVPAGNVKGSYTSTLTWTLNNTPQA